MRYKKEIVTAYFEACKLPPPEFEHRFHPERKWRMDLAWPDHKVYLEVDGGIWVGGGHNRGAQMVKDWEKRNTAAAMGWRLIQCQPKELCTENTVRIIKECLEVEK